MRIVHPAVELVGVTTPKRNGGQLRGHARFLRSRVGGHETNFVDTNSARAGQSGFQLQGQLRGFGFAGWESAHEAIQLVLRDGREELHTADACGREQLGKLFFRGRALKWHAIQQ